MNIKQACKMLSDEKCIILPSDTIYGIAALAYSKDATQQVFQIKNRSLKNKLPIHYSNLIQASKDIIITPLIQEIAEKFLPGALTIIAKKRHNSQLQLQKDTIAFRIPNNKILLEIISKLNKPITMTSANKTNHPTSTRFKEIEKELHLTGIEDDKNVSTVPSTIIDTTSNQVKLIRKGKISKETLENILHTKIA